MKKLFSFLFLALSVSAYAQSTTNLSITKPQPSDSQWSITASGFDKFDAAVAGRLSKSVAGGSDVTLTDTEARNRILEFTGTLTGNINVIVPSKNRSYIIYNNTAGAFTLTVKTAAGTGIAVTQGNRVLLYCDSTNVVALSATGGSVAGSNKQIQYNNSGAFAGATGFEWQNASPNVTITAQDASHVPLVAKGAASQSANLFQARNSSDATLFGITSAGNIESSTDGSSTGSPRTFGFINLSSGEAGRVQFGDPYTAFQNAFDARLQIYAYWGIDIQGSRQTTSAPSFVTGQSTDPTVSIKTAQGGNPTLVVDGTGVEGSNSVPIAKIVKGGQSNNAVERVLDLVNNDTSTTGDVGMGVRIRAGLESSSTDDRDASAIDTLWTTATDASRTSAIVFSTVNNGGSLAERVRIDAQGLRIGNSYVSPGGLLPIDLPPVTPNAADDEFDSGSNFDTAGTRFSGANAWTKYESAGGNVVSDITTGAGTIQLNAVGSNSIQGYYQTLAAGDFKYRAKINLTGDNATSNYGGLFLHDATGGKLEGFYMRPHVTAGNIPALEKGRWTNQTTFDGTGLVRTGVLSNGFTIYLEIERSSTTLNYRYSTDGRKFVLMTSNSETAHMANSPNRIGVFFNTSSTNSHYISVEWFRKVN